MSDSTLFSFLSDEKTARAKTERLIEAALKAGAEQADAVLVEQGGENFTCRQGEMEASQRSDSSQIGLRVMAGGSWGGLSVEAGSLATAAQEEALASRALALAKASPPDPHASLPQEGFVRWPESNPLDLYDSTQPERLAEQALAAEAAGLANKAVKNSLGADAGFSQSQITRMASNGFSAQWQGSRHQISCAFLAGEQNAEGGGMERDYAYATTRHAADLPAPEILGEKAARRAAARLNAKAVATGAVPVLFDKRSARSLLGHLATALSGPLLARGGSFLREALGEKIFSEAISIYDDPFLPRGLRSRPCDSEGYAGEKRAIIKQGVLQNFLLDGISAARLNLSPTGHASAGPGSAPDAQPSNFYLVPSKMSEKELFAACGTGFWVRELSGQGVNMLTGDYSRGASGFWIERGEIAFPVSGVVIAGNLKTMFASLIAGGDLPADPQTELGWRTGMDAPSLLVPSMMVAA